MKKVLLQQAFVLHNRSYRETSLLIELFTPDHGRLSVIAKGVRQLRSVNSGLLQPFVPLLVSFAGKGELMTLTHAELSGTILALQGDGLFAGFYLNELLMGLLQKWDAHPRLFAMYHTTLMAIGANSVTEQDLRRFEKCLLQELGYGLLPTSQAALENSFIPEKYYRYTPENGFIVCEEAVSESTTANIFSGKSLLNIAIENWQDEQSLRDAKRLMRFALTHLLGSRPIYSRRLFTKSLKRDEYEER